MMRHAPAACAAGRQHNNNNVEKAKDCMEPFHALTSISYVLKGNVVRVVVAL